MVERKKDIIKYKGYTILPSEVESAIREYPQVEEVCVVGTQANETEFGQFVKAFVVPKETYRTTIRKEEIINFCNDKLAAYKLPKEVEFVDKLPKNSIGKVVRKELR
jgi:long-chain acyl-CoA synthetase